MDWVSGVKPGERSNRAENRDAKNESGLRGPTHYDKLQTHASPSLIPFIHRNTEGSKQPLAIFDKHQNNLKRPVWRIRRFMWIFHYFDHVVLPKGDISSLKYLYRILPQLLKLSCLTGQIKGCSPARSVVFFWIEGLFCEHSTESKAGTAEHEWFLNTN